MTAYISVNTIYILNTSVFLLTFTAIFKFLSFYLLPNKDFAVHAENMERPYFVDKYNYMSNDPL